MVAIVVNHLICYVCFMLVFILVYKKQPIPFLDEVVDSELFVK